MGEMSWDIDPPVRSDMSAAVLTVLIADMRGYTRFTAEHGDAQAARLAGRFAGLAREVIEEFEGRVVELRGDEALCMFPSARNALRASISIQQRFAAAAESGPSLPLGIGLDAGEAVPVEGGYRGGALNLAARLCSLAGAGEVFASQTVIELARKTEGLMCVDRGTVRLKGLSTPVRVFQIAPEGGLSEELPPLQPSPTGHPTNLPDEPTAFIGRESEVAAVSELLHRPTVRLVTLTGPGGTGKTRLALRISSMLLGDFDSGVFFTSLGSVANPALVASSIAQALALREIVGRSPQETVSEFLDDKHLLLVLDNFEHLLEASSLVAALLDSCPSLHILVTSRSPLRLAREREFMVPPLSIPDIHRLPPLDELSRYEAVALFVDRAQAVGAGLAVTVENARDIVEVCRRLDGLPLAIELAAARVKIFPPRALVGRLSSTLQLLAGGPHDLPARQRTLRGAIDWSYGLLTEGEKTLFARLSVFSGGCTLEAAEAICDADHDFPVNALDGISSLIEKSLLRQVGEDEARFLMLETIREYSLERLTSSGEADSLRRRHAEFFLELARSDEQEAEAQPATVWVGHLQNERDNLRAALRWVIDDEPERARAPEESVPYYLAAARVAQRIHAHEEAVELLAKALALLEKSPESRERDERELTLRTALGLSLVTIGGSYASSDAIEAYERARTLCARLGRPSSPPILRALALAFVFRGRIPEAHDLGEQLLSAAQRDPAPMLLVEAHYLLGVTSFWLGEFARARVHLDQALASYDPARYRTHSIWYAWDPGVVCYVRSGLVLWFLGYPDQARQKTREGLALAETLSHPLTLAYALNFAAWLASYLGDVEATHEYGESLVALSRDAHLDYWARMGAIFLGYVRTKRGGADAGVAQMREAIAGFKVKGEYHHLSYALGLVAEGCSQTGRVYDGLDAVAEGLLMADRTAEHFWDAELHRLRGELLQVHGAEAVEVEASFSQALAISQRQNARSLELRASMSLARLWQHESRQDEALHMLATMYSWFTEGLDTADLREARTLLDKLTIAGDG
jgi:predicted ATPase/class 3 adenylate cyclase